MLVTINLPDNCAVSMDESKARRYLRDFRRLGLNMLGGDYEYEQVDGNKVRGKFIGYSGLNLKFVKTDSTEFMAPVIDMGDGSLVTEYLTACLTLGTEL